MILSSRCVYAHLNRTVGSCHSTWALRAFDSGRLQTLAEGEEASARPGSLYQRSALSAQPRGSTTASE